MGEVLWEMIGWYIKLSKLTPMHLEFLQVFLYWLTEAKFNTLVHQSFCAIWVELPGNEMT